MNAMTEQCYLLFFSSPLHTLDTGTDCDIQTRVVLPYNIFI